MQQEYDIVIVGSGLAGNCLALALKDTGLRIAIVEASTREQLHASPAGDRALALAAGTVMKVEFEDPLVKTYYNPKLKPGGADPNNILAIQFMVPTNDSAPVDWDFCVEDIAAITAP